MDGKAWGMANGITRATFDSMDADAKLGVLFDYAHDQHARSCATRDQLEELKEKFERRKRFDTTISGGSGIIGGALAMLLKWVIGK